MTHRILKNAGVSPGWIEADKTVRALLDERDRLLARVQRSSPLGRMRARDEMIRLVEAANRAILRVNIEAPTDRQQRRPLDLDVELESLETAASAESPTSREVRRV